MDFSIPEDDIVVKRTFTPVRLYLPLQTIAVHDELLSNGEGGKEIVGGYGDGRKKRKPTEASLGTLSERPAYPDLESETLLATLQAIDLVGVPDGI